MPAPEHLMRKQELRGINKRLRDVAELDNSVFICECSDGDCVDTLELSLEEYDRIRSVQAWFVLTPGHADPALDRVVDENDQFVVVEHSTEDTT